MEYFQVLWRKFVAFDNNVQSKVVSGSSCSPFAPTKLINNDNLFSSQLLLVLLLLLLPAHTVYTDQFFTQLQLKGRSVCVHLCMLARSECVCV